MMNAHLFEAIMLVCFGCAWPVSIYKSYTSRMNQGKSIFFLYIVMIGYISGVIYQYLISVSVNYIFYIFFINICLVAVDILIYYRNKRIQLV